MRSLTLFLLLAAAASSPADELDLHRAAVLDRMIRELAPRDRAGIVFVRQMEHCWTDEGRQDGCVDLSDEAMQWLRARGHGVDRVPEESRYYIHGHPSEHKGTFNPPHPDWLYLPIYTPAAERRTYCEVALIRGLYPDGAVHIRGSCRAAPPDLKILVSGDFLVRQQGETFLIEPFTPPPDCVLPRPVDRTRFPESAFGYHSRRNFTPLRRLHTMTTTIEINPGAPLTVLSEEEQMFQQSVRDFAIERIRPLVHQMDHDATMDKELIQSFFELGIMGIEIPEQYGGAGSTFFTAVLIVEEVSHVDASCGVLVDVQNTLVNNALVRWGSEDQKSKYLKLLSTDTVGAYALSEAGSGSDAFALATKAEDREDHWVLNGRKLWITNAAEAGVFIVFANANPDAGYKGITAFIVERDFPGFQVGKKEDKTGIRASSTCELILEDCRVPKENVLGEIGKGYKIAIETLNEGRIGIGAQMLGVARGALEYAIAYTKERKQFGQRIADFQGVQFQIAQAATELEAARLMVYNAARLKDAGKPFLREAAMAKLFSSHVAEKVTSLAVQLYGGNGYTKEYPVEKFWRDSKVGQIYEGTSNMQLATIAKTILTGRL